MHRPEADRDAKCQTCRCLDLGQWQGRWRLSHRYELPSQLPMTSKSGGYRSLAAHFRLSHGPSPKWRSASKPECSPFESCMSPPITCTSILRRLPILKCGVDTAVPETFMANRLLTVGGQLMEKFPLFESSRFVALFGTAKLAFPVCLGGQG